MNVEKIMFLASSIEDKSKEDIIAASKILGMNLDKKSINKLIRIGKKKRVDFIELLLDICKCDYVTINTTLEDINYIIKVL